MSQQPQPNSEEVLALPNFDDDTDEQVSPVARPRRRRNTIIAISILLLIVLLAALLLPPLLRPKKPTTYQYQKVSQSSFALTVSATGPLQSGTYNVVFSGTGKLTEIDVAVGQKVTEGQTLAKLDKTSLLDALNQAKAAVNEALVAVGNGQAGLGATQGQSQANDSAAATAVANAKTSQGKTLTQSQASIVAAQATLASDQTNLTNVQAQSQASINAAQTTLTNDQTNLTNVQAQSRASINAAQTTLTSDQTNLTNVQAQSQASINAAQTTLASDQTNLTNVQAQSQASINTAYSQEQQAIIACNTQATATPTPTPSTYGNCIQLAQNQYNQAVATANANTATAQAKVTADQQQLNTARTTANANNSTAQAKVTSDQQQLNTAQTTANANNSTAQAKITTDQQQLNTAQTTANANNSTAQAKVTADQKQLGVTLGNAGVSNTTAQNQVSTSQSQLITSQANGGLSSTTQQNQVNTAQSQLQTAIIQQQTAQHNVDNATLKAPHAGIVTTINGTVGGTPGASTASSSTASATAGGGTFIQIADDTSLQVLANVNESDVANLQVGDAVQFTVSAYGEREFRGTVGAISPSGQTVSNVVTYPVTIDLDMSSAKGVQLLPGMTADAVITVVNQPNTLVIPVEAINFARLASSSGSTSTSVSQLISKQDAASAMAQARQAMATLETQNPNLIADSPIPAYVIEQLHGKFIAKPVVLGLTDDTVYEVLQGLSADDTIVVGVQSTPKRGLA